MSRTFYMHTINGRPAAYCSEYGYIYHARPAVKTTEMCKSLEVLRRQQRDAKEHHQQTPGINGDEYGYIRIVVDY